MANELKSAEVGGREAGYLFEFKPDGVFLTVYPATDSVLFELSDMRQILKEYGVMDYNMVDLARVVRAADGKPFRLASTFEATVTSVKKDGGNKGEPVAIEAEKREVMAFQIEVSKDRMTATMKIDRQPGRVPPHKEDIMKALEERRIVFGIDEGAIERYQGDWLHDAVNAVLQG